MNWTWALIGVAAVAVVGILIADPFDWRDNNADRYRLERDSVIVEAAEWKRLYEQEVVNRKNCEERWANREIETDTIEVPDQRALQYVMTTLRETKDSLEAMRKIAAKLRKQLFTGKENDYLFSDKYVTLGLHAYGVHDPLEGTTELHYNLDSYELGEKQIIYQEREIPVYVSSAYVYAELGIGRNWRQQKFQMPFGVGLFADLSKVFSVDVQALHGVWIGNGIDVSSNAMLRYKW